MDNVKKVDEVQSNDVKIDGAPVGVPQFQPERPFSKDELDALVNQIVANKLDEERAKRRERIEEAEKVLAKAKENERLEEQYNDNQSYNLRKSYIQQKEQEYVEAVKDLIDKVSRNKMPMDYYDDVMSNPKKRDIANFIFGAQKFGPEKMLEIFRRNYRNILFNA